jgi:hypothetical protein
LEAKKPAEPAEICQDFSPKCGTNKRLDTVDKLVARIDIDSRLTVSGHEKCVEENTFAARLKSRGRMQGRRSETTGGVFAAIRRGLFRVENDADGHGAFTAAEWWLSDRLEGASYRSAIREVNAQAGSSKLFRLNKKGPAAPTTIADGLSAA